MRKRSWVIGLALLMLVGAGCGQEGGDVAEALDDVLLRTYLAFHREDIAKTASDDPSPVVFVVEPGDTAGDIALRLKRRGLIVDSELFRQLAQYEKADSSLEAGRYELRANMTLREIIAALQHGRIEEIAVTIPEGWRAEQIAKMLVDAVGVDGDQFLDLVRGSQLDAEFLQSHPPEATLEGFLFPDTYLLPIQPTALEVLERMLANFDERFTTEMRQAVVEQQMTIHQVVTLASIVEREAVVAEERPIIAGVFLKRLEDGMKLESCPTVQYAMGYQEETAQWWKTPVMLGELDQVQSLYNTYLHQGLPPGPICNPGLAAIQAVLEPVESDYLYFLAKGDGSHAFARTFEEHLQNQQEYQR